MTVFLAEDGVLPAARFGLQLRSLGLIIKIFYFCSFV